MEKIIYHGSEKIIQVPQYGVGNTRNDYGRGFYCTEDIELAKEWACGNENNGYVNIYKLDMNGLKILNLNSEEYGVLHWLAILADNRTYWKKGSIAEENKKYLKENYLIDLSAYDVVIGYRADDSYFSYANNFVGNTISLTQLEKAMKLGNLGEQVVLKSKKAFSQIKFIDFEEARADIYFHKKILREKEARENYKLLKKEKISSEDLLMIDIVRRGL